MGNPAPGLWAARVAPYGARTGGPTEAGMAHIETKGREARSWSAPPVRTAPLTSPSPSPVAPVAAVPRPAADGPPRPHSARAAVAALAFVVVGILLLVGVVAEITAERQARQDVVDAVCRLEGFASATYSHCVSSDGGLYGAPLPDNVGALRAAREHQIIVGWLTGRAPPRMRLSPTPAASSPPPAPPPADAGLAPY